MRQVGGELESSITRTSNAAAKQLELKIEAFPMSVIVDAGSMAHLANQLSSEIDPAGCGFWFGVSVVLTRAAVLRDWLARGLAGSQNVVWKAVWLNATKVQVFQILQILLFFMLAIDTDSRNPQGK